jgi:hypothetical protein
MINENLLLLIIFLILFVLFYIANILFKKNIEKYGVYCGRYNLASAGTAKSQCEQDKECKWNVYNVRGSNTPSGWCGQNPTSTGDVSAGGTLYDQFSDLFHTYLNPTVIINNVRVPLSQTTGITL